MEPNQLQDLQDQITRLRSELGELQAAFYKNNFSTSQDFNKESRFNYRLKVPHYDTAPATGEVGEIIEVGGVLGICDTANHFVVVGTQT